MRRLINRVSVEASFFKKMSAVENLSYAARFYGMAPKATRNQIPEILERVGFPVEVRCAPADDAWLSAMKLNLQEWHLLLREKQNETMRDWVNDLQAKYKDEIAYAPGFAPAATTTGIRLPARSANHATVPAHGAFTTVSIFLALTTRSPCARTSRTARSID